MVAGSGNLIFLAVDVVEGLAVEVDHANRLCRVAGGVERHERHTVVAERSGKAQVGLDHGVALDVDVAIAVKVGVDYRATVAEHRGGE